MEDKKVVKMSKESWATIVLWKTTTKFQLVGFISSTRKLLLLEQCNVKDWCVPTRVICVTISVFYFVYFPSFSFLGTQICVNADIRLVGLHSCSALIGRRGSSSGKWLAASRGRFRSISLFLLFKRPWPNFSLFIFHLLLWGLDAISLKSISPLSHYLASRASWSC